MNIYESIKFLIFKINEYPFLKVKMAICLEATNPEYLNMMYDGPHRPMKLAVVILDQEKNMVVKDKKDYYRGDL